jgi:hypothetical protein
LSRNPSISGWDRADEFRRQLRSHRADHATDEEPGMKDVCMRDGWSESIERLAQIKHEGDVQ